MIQHLEKLKNLKRYFPSKEERTFKKIVFWGITGFIGLFLLGLIATTGLITILSIGLPDVNDLENLTAAQSTQIFDRKGNLLYTIHGEENREYIEYAKITPALIDATVAIEDDTFWEHGGFDIWAIGKAGLNALFGIGAPRGGSTITQQYVKNTFLSSERSYVRKVKELILAIRLEKAYNKEEILGLYLNRIPYGNNAYGCEKASEVYFGKNCGELTLGESSILAALPQAPSRYNPYGDNKYSHLLKEFTEDELFYRNIESEKDLLTEEYIRGLIGKYVDLNNGKKIYIQGRTDLVLKRMHELSSITKEERQGALDELQKTEFNNYREPIESPHFTLYVKQLLEERYGKDVVEQGGLKVYTTIDPTLQQYSEKIAAEYGASNATRFNANNVAIMTINTKTGEILTMVGSRDYFNEEIDGNVNVALRPRQPGSSFKPIVYAQAFYNGYGPGSVVYDIPTKIGNDKPLDFDGKWRGQMTIRQALGQSRNIPAIKAYFLAGQQDPIINLAAKMGIKSLDKAHSYGYPLALGAGEVPLIEMVTAYGTFANSGKKPELTAILKVENANGDILEEWKQKEFEEVIDPQIAFLINSILSDQSVSIGPRLFIPDQVNAAKTGTSTKENKKTAGTSAVRPSDGWTIGYTPTIVTGVWIGNTDGSGMNFNADGYDSGAPIFNAVMSKALSGKAAEPFPEPKGIEHIEIGKASGLLPSSLTPKSMIVTEVFPSFSVPTEVENIFFEVKIDKISGLLATEYTPQDAIETVVYQNYQDIADMLNWTNEVKAYYKDNSETFEEGMVRIGTPPAEYDNIHTPETAANAPAITITAPAPQAILSTGNITIEVDLKAKNGIAEVEFYLDDQKEFSSKTSPYKGHINISKFLKPGSKHLIVAKIIDSLGYSAQSAIEIKIGEDIDTVVQ
ncbi:penicillin-binding protein [Candidatus Peregrinibacteria bacterium]|nr:penicillin-binding protein [Candidatus Peregrinibacteria bacterium]